MTSKMITYKYKVYGKRATFRYLDSLAREVNFVWNYCNETSEKIFSNHIKTHYFVSDPKNPEKKIRRRYSDVPAKVKFYYSNEDVNTYKGGEQYLEFTPGFISGYDLMKLLGGASKYLNLPQNSVIAICKEFDKAKKTKMKLISEGKISHSGRNFIGFRGKKAKPWIPLKAASIKYDHQTGELLFNKRKVRLNIDRVIDGEIRDAKFVREADGWYCCISVKRESYGHRFRSKESGTLGVDLGLKTYATRSDGVKIEYSEPEVTIFGKTFTVTKAIDYLKSKKDKLKNKRLFNSKYRFLERKIRKLEKYGKEHRRHFHFNSAYKLLSDCDTLVVGDLSGKFIQSMAGKKSKQYSVGIFKDRLEWIALKSQKSVVFVNERDTTVSCSECGERTGPSGDSDLGVREWVCSNCGAEHDRDVNAAKNMIAVYDRGSGAA